MGVTFVDVTVQRSSRSKRSRKVKCQVDSGASYSVIPREILRELRIGVDLKQKFTLADGPQVEPELGTAYFKLNGREGSAMVIFGEPGDATLLGVLTLQSLGLVLHPLERELRQLPLLLV
jgi:predicted aspartyl protease